MCYIGKWRMLRIVSDPLSWGNKKVKQFLELKAHARKDLGKSLNHPACICILVRGLLFEVKPGTWARKVLTHTNRSPSLGSQGSLSVGYTMESDSPVVRGWQSPEVRDHALDHTCPTGQKSGYWLLGVPRPSSVVSFTNDMQYLLIVLSSAAGDDKKWSTVKKKKNTHAAQT